MTSEYQDRFITCTSDGIAIRSYYFPAGTKYIPYASIRWSQRVAMGAVTGRGRIWGTANPRHWAHLDPRRPFKRQGLILEVGGAIQPLLTPDDPAAVEACIREHAGDVVTSAPRRGPII